MKSIQCLVVVLIAVCVSVIIGCSDEAAVKLKADRAAFDEAVASLQALPDYVPVDFGSADMSKPANQLVNQLSSKINKTWADLAKNADLQAARQAQIDEAAGKLQKVLTLGLPAQQAAALGLLSDAYASQARHTHRAAMTSWSEIQHESGKLISYVTAIDITDHRARKFDANVAALKGELDTFQAKTRSEHEGLKTRADDLNSKITALDQEIAKWTQTRDNHRNNSQSLRSDATNATGVKQRTMILDAIKAERESSKAATEIERRTVFLDVHKHELSIIDRKLKIKQLAEDEIDAAISGTAKRKQNHEQERGQAATDLQTIADTLQAAFEKIDGAYKDSVAKGLDLAAANMEKAIAEATKAQKKADRSTKAISDLMVATKNVELVHILTEHCEAASGYGNNLATLTARAKSMGVKNADAFEARYNEIKKKQTDDADKAREAADAASEIISGMSSQEDEVGLVARRQADHVTGYKERLDASKLAAEIPVGSVARAAITGPRIVGPGVEPPVPTPPTPTPPGPGPAGGATITEAMAALPDIATGESVMMVVRLDGRLISPKIVKDTVISLAGPQAMEKVGMPLMMYTGAYGQFANAGGKGVVLIFPMEEGAAEPQPVILVGTKDGSTPDGFKALITQIAGDPAAVDEAEYSQVTPDWLAMSQKGKALPAGGSQARRALIEAALGANGDAALSVGIIIDDKTRALAEKGSAAAEGAPVDVEAAKEFLAKMQWVGVAVKLGDNVGIYTTTKFNDAETATAAKEKFEAELAKMLKPPADGEPDPFGGMGAMVGGMLKGAIQVQVKDDQLTINLAGPGFKGIAQMAIGMAMSAGGGAEPGGPPIAPPDDGDAPPAPDPFK